MIVVKISNVRCSPPLDISRHTPSYVQHIPSGNSSAGILFPACCSTDNFHFSRLLSNYVSPRCYSNRFLDFEY